MDGIPVCDITPLRSGLAAERAAVAAAIGAACREIGFFYVTGTGIAAAQVAAVFDAAHRFFALPAAEKQALSIQRVGKNRGYVGLGTERLDAAAPADRKEAFNIGLELPPDHPEIAGNRPFRALNAWPALPGWRATMLDYYDACWNVSRVLHRAFALDLGMPEGHFDPLLNAPAATLRLLHYPPAGDAAAGDIGAGAHTDYGNLTILATDGVAGLQVQRRDGVWIDAPAIPDSFVCNIGDTLMRWSNDVYVSTPHRVGLPAANRYSVAFFFDADPDAVVEVLPSCVRPGEAAKYAPVTAGDYLQSRLNATYDHLKSDSRRTGNR